MPASRGAPEILVVGAGLSGLACAHDLLSAGLDVGVLEASDGVGGRMRSDRVDGHVIDRGFQVFNTSYPQAKRRLALRDLRLRPFTPGVLVHTDRGRFHLADPTRAPRTVKDLLGAGPAGPRDLLALGVLSGRDMLGPVGPLKRAEDHTTRTALAAAGISEEFTELFFRPFLSGVFLEEDLETSSRVFHLVWRSMLRGTLCLPSDGIGEVPRQLADALPTGTVRFGSPVDRLTDDGVLLADGTETAADVVVVATGPGPASRLLPDLDMPPYRVVTTYFHTAPKPPLTEPTLLTDTRLRFLNSCVLSEVVPGYAPAGSSLVAASVLGEDTEGRERALRDALSEAYGTDTAGWDLLTVRTVHEALPAMPPPQPLTRTSRAGTGRYVCGDHRTTGSVQGALSSGSRAAREILRDLGR
ncbi:NAD(P)/FAD-dependent oxidoreductase [Streptomyces niveus]|uniref:Amine oxidase n=1 Tax=Streptomyces niveus TaxID=193462 RepID=A0A1U9QNY6_STRNV|nr:NAD(P)/FAD-dependent oxidoreductase [Streptomyces niveus]AQU65988.1 amine oxidase [Streptomyces niveus]